MKPPTPTSNQASAQEEKKKQRLAALIPMGAGLLTILAFALYTFWQDSHAGLPVPLYTGLMQSRQLGPLAADDDDGGQDGSLEVARSAGDLVIQREFDRPLVGEPANLEAPQGGRRVAGFQRRDGDVVEQITIWELSRSAAAADEYYRKQATLAGFQALQSKAAVGPQAVFNAVYVRSRPPGNAVQGPPAEQVLVIRTTPRGNAACQAFVWLREASRP